MIRQIKRPSKSFLRAVILAVLFSQSSAQADFLSDVSGFFSRVWQNNKTLLTTAGVSLAALGLYSYFWWLNSSKPTNATLTGVHIGIPISDTHLSQLNKQLLHIQKIIKKTAEAKGYYFETQSVDSNGFHISLENVQGIEQEQVARYATCVAAFAKTISSIDLSRCLAHAKFEIFESGWGVLELPMTNNCVLKDIANNLRESLKQAGLAVSKFDNFKAHISLGKFTSYKNKQKPNDTSWLPKITINMPKEQCIATNIVLATRRKEIKNKKMQVTTAPNYTYQLA